MEIEQRKQILVVDDEEPVCLMMLNFLRREGYECQSTVDPITALVMLEDDNFGLVVSDITMPGMNGLDLVREIRQKHPLVDTIIMTGHTGDFTYSDIIQAGAADFIGKPFQMAELKAKVERVERERRILREVQKANAVLEVTLDRMHAIIEFLPDPTFVVDETGKVVAWNRAIEKMTGISRSDMLQKGNFEYAIAFYGERRPMLIDFALSLTPESAIEKYHYVQREGNRLSR